MKRIKFQTYYFKFFIIPRHCRDVHRINFRRIIACTLIFFSHEHVLVEKTKKICRNLWLLTRQPIKSSAIRTGSTRYCYCNNAFRSHKEVNNSHACVLEFDTAHVVRPFSIDTLHTWWVVTTASNSNAFKASVDALGAYIKGVIKAVINLVILLTTLTAVWATISRTFKTLSLLNNRWQKGCALVAGVCGESLWRWMAAVMCSAGNVLLHGPTATIQHAPAAELASGIHDTVVNGWVGCPWPPRSCHPDSRFWRWTASTAVVWCRLWRRSTLTIHFIAHCDSRSSERSTTSCCKTTTCPVTFTVRGTSWKPVVSTMVFPSEDRSGRGNLPKKSCFYSYKSELKWTKNCCFSNLSIF